MREKESESGARSTLEHSAFVAVAAVLVASVLLGVGMNIDHTDVAPELRAGFLLRLILAVFGLALTEQVLRRVQPRMRWGIKPLAVALGGVFGLELLFYADAMLTPAIFEDRAPSLSRVPPQSGHVVNVTARSTKARRCGWSESVSFDSIDCWIRGTRPW